MSDVASTVGMNDSAPCAVQSYMTECGNILFFDAHLFQFMRSHCNRRFIFYEKFEEKWITCVSAGDWQRA